MEFLVHWENFPASENSWLPYSELILNTFLKKFIKDIWTKHGDDIYITQANFKERIKSRVRKTYSYKKKAEIMLEIHPFDPEEFKVAQVVYQLNQKNIPESFTKRLEELFFRNHFFSLDKEQQKESDALIAKIKEVDKDMIVTIENYEDFDPVPTFTYVKNNFLTDAVNTSILESPTKNDPKRVKGCSCENGVCKPTTKCCPKLVPKKKIAECSCGSTIMNCERTHNCTPKYAHEEFAYKSLRGNAILKFEEVEKIFECNDNCSCGPDCLNRVSQKPSQIPICLFKTESRGWGIKAMSDVEKGRFIIEYAGEILGNKEADKRQETQYLFDLNMDRAENGYYTIDANFYASLGRFVNHSCEPNARIWFINDCMQSPESQKICIFADRKIKKDEEITIDYSPKDSVPVDRANSSQHIFKECLCGTKLCRGNIY